MSEHRATVFWERGNHDFTYETYPRDHTWEFEGGTRVSASAAPSYRGNAALVDPEEAFVASVSSCHMLTFLALAAKKNLVVDGYTDRAVGRLEKTPEGPMAVTRITLRPQIEFGGGRRPSPEQLEALHHEAHTRCFIANSVKTDISVETPQAAAT